MTNYLDGVPPMYPEMKIGDEFTWDAPPPPTMLDRILWRLFRIERKRPRIRQRFVVTAMGTAQNKNPARD